MKIQKPETQSDVIELLKKHRIRIEYFPKDGTYRFPSNDLYELLKLIQNCVEQDQTK